MTEELRERRSDCRVIPRVSAYFQDEPQRGLDERGRYAVAGPPEWIAERLAAYVEVGCDGFVVNLDYDSPGLEHRVWQFAQQVMPSLGK
jgi:alkanesulfonate monooxygenase SsuD/methylene tetrahydromethanopterin reductase-like flavin-dependent oxidoreductase (luciferase family)